MDEYIQRRQNMVTQFIATWSLLDLCEVTERKTGARVVMRWWEHAVLDLVGARESAAAAAEAYEERMEK